MSVTIYRVDAVQGWLAFARRAVCTVRQTGRPRRSEDERAACAAREVALAACGMQRGPVAFSVSHTEGSAAVLAGTATEMFGVDLIRFARVTPRHSRAILSRDDAEAFGTMPTWYRDALAWALKEAAAKATGAPQQYFPDRIHLIAGPFPGALRVRIVSETPIMLSAAWFVSGGLLCALVATRMPRVLIPCCAITS